MNTHDELQLAHKVGRTLNKGIDSLDSGIRDRLEAGRRRALERQKMAIAGFSLAGIGHFAGEVLLPQARTLAALLVLALGIVGNYYWNHFQEAMANVAIDSALLADDLPINAYLDRGFSAWLEHPSQLPPQ